ncbi:MAG: phosphoglycerate mutase, 2,3-bisphosphoglycerate-independent phosphoglycerate mutase [Candidatus Berkelbacteria bacterium]|nr:phosphoglycerate mutase, 2,3-bisphosphoglycerate-independent phosphoglycerate mutase [Candidatus Berkelbacteria bacterium]
MNPLVLVILDGWGLSPVEQGNAILTTPTPNYDQIMSFFPSASLRASGEEVGLSWGEMGNSEVGHLNMGTGRIIMQDLPRIDKAIQDGTFFANKDLLFAYKRLSKIPGNNLHLVGLVSAGGVHSHINHLFALLELAAKLNIKNVYIHLITDGRDTPAKVALNDLAALEQKCSELGTGKVASVMGRYFIMDRDKHWDRVQKGYDCMLNENYPQAGSAKEAIEAAYNTNKSDEFIEPIAITGTARIKNDDSIVFFNYRSDRAKQISDAIINRDFKGFPRKKFLNKFYFISFTSYGHEPSPNVKVAFFAEKVTNPLAQIISQNNLTQLHIAETEKFAHVTYFFNAGIEKELPGEQRLLIQSPPVDTYDLKPEMSAREVTESFLQYFRTRKPLFTVLNFANPDMVGHTGILAATQKAIATIDTCLGKLSYEVLSAGANLIITADHGNAEQMINPQTNEPDKEHTTNPVPVILAFNEKRLSQPQVVDINYKINIASSAPVGVLADVTATCLDLLNLSQPPEITGQSLRKVL